MLAACPSARHVSREKSNSAVGCLGGSVVRWMNRTLMRIGIVTLGFGIAAYYFWRIYGGGIHLVGSD